MGYGLTERDSTHGRSVDSFQLRHKAPIWLLPRLLTKEDNGTPITPFVGDKAAWV